MMINININKMLDDRDKTMYWLAQETGLSYPTIHRLASSKTQSINFETLALICISLNCEVGEILELNKDA